ncbi:MAG TPA: uracil-DNA glycosylase [Burkholderiales bacterium]|nr:uracil-DNA glycosylase [Burkholderiales bacterium]
MRNKSSYKLLFNNLWLAEPEKIKKLNPALKIGYILGNNQKMNMARERAALLSIEQEVLPKNYKIEDTVGNFESKKNIAALLSKPDFLSNKEKPTDIQIKTLEKLINNWEELQETVTNCNKCDLCYGRKNVVIERGSRAAKWMFIGEGPGAEEDKQGLPFVGVSGQLLDKMIAAMKLSPQNDAYICNVVKCRPPYNRNPEKTEINACQNFLFSQIDLIKPKIIVTLGRFASQTLLNTDLATGKLRGKVYKFNDIPVIVTYHPAYLLRNPEAKKDAWVDLQLAIKTIENYNAN